MENKNQLKPLGSINSINSDLFTVKLNNFTINKLSLLVGMNGSGKTLTMILVWCISLIVCIYLSCKNIAQCEAALQWIFDKSFEKNDFTGTVEVEYDHLELSFKMNNGKISDLLFVERDKIDPKSAGMPQFMSKNTRLFTDIIQYIKVKKLMGLKGTIDLNNAQDIEKLTEMYKLYDILFIEKMLLKLSNPFIKVSSVVNDNFLKDTHKRIDTIFYDEKTSDILYTGVLLGKDTQGNNTETKLNESVTILSAGEQSILNMFIGSTM